MGVQDVNLSAGSSTYLQPEIQISSKMYVLLATLTYIPGISHIWIILMFHNFSFVCAHKQRGNTVKSVMNINNAHIFDLWKDAEISTGNYVKLTVILGLT
jgi:hypothetical protein